MALQPHDAHRSQWRARLRPRKQLSLTTARSTSRISIMEIEQASKTGSRRWRLTSSFILFQMNRRHCSLLAFSEEGLSIGSSPTYANIWATMMKTKGESLPTLGNSRRNFGGSLERPSGTSNSALISEDLCIGLHSQVSGCANLTDWDNASLIMMFRQGLKENLKDELMCDGRELLNMKVLMEVAIEIDDKLYERAMEKRFDQPNHGREETFFGPTSGYYGGKSRSNTNRYSNPDYRGPAPMELDSTQRRKEKNPRGKQDNKPQNQATSSRDCCSRNLVDRRQINAMLREIPDSQLQRVLD
jgi:hypothetical protein